MNNESTKFILELTTDPSNNPTIQPIVLEKDEWSDDAWKEIETVLHPAVCSNESWKLLNWIHDQHYEGCLCLDEDAEEGLTHLEVVNVRRWDVVNNCWIAD